MRDDAIRVLRSNNRTANATNDASRQLFVTGYLLA
jgi:hypothetical protein